MVRPTRARGPAAPPAPRRAWVDRLPWLGAILAAAAPLWASRDLPFVDLPQHLYVVAVINRIHDPATLFPGMFELRPEPTPYLGYYALVSVLARLVTLEVADRLFLTAYVIAFPLSLAFLLRSLGRPAWPALLAIPFAYGDSLAWGFFNYCAGLPVAFLGMGLFIRALTAPSGRLRWAIALALSLLAGIALHPVPIGYLALAFPLLLMTTRAGGVPAETAGRSWLRPRLPALAGVLPAALVALAWALALLTRPTAVEVGVPHHAWGPIFSGRNLQFETLAVNLDAFPILLANMMNDGSDRLGLQVVTGIALLAFLARAFERPARVAPPPPWGERLRPAALVALAAACYLALPLNIQGYVQYLNPRFSHLVAALAVGLVPRLGARSARLFPWLALLAALATALPLVRGFRAFDREAAPLHVLAAAAADRPRVMGLMLDFRSRVVHHPVHLHSAATLARERGGVPNYCLAGWRQAPIRYRGTPPPTFPSEWRADLFDYNTQGEAYDHFLGRGVEPDKVFGERLGHELYLAARAGDYWLVRRRE